MFEQTFKTIDDKPYCKASAKRVLVLSSLPKSAG